MIPTLSSNTQAILLLTAPLIIGRGTSTPDLLKAGEYRRLARLLRDIQQQPADLVGPHANDILRACQPAVEEDRLKRLLGRGFLLSQAIERWQTRAIWVISRADADYPRRFKARFREDAPAVLYGCGDVGLLENGGLAVVGSRDVDAALIDYTMSVGSLAARAGRAVVSGGAKGIDQAAMRGALEAGGQVCGVLADSLEKNAMNREHRNMLLDGQLTLVSPYDPGAGFNVGNAMQRNKLIYALADASLVVSSDINKGGTWTGAVEQLEKLRFVPVYVRSIGEPSPGLEALLRKGALRWPNPVDVEALEEVFAEPAPLSPKAEQGGLPLDAGDARKDDAYVLPKLNALQTEEGNTDVAAAANLKESPEPDSSDESRAVTSTSLTSSIEIDNVTQIRGIPAENLFSAVREAIRQILSTPMKESDVAAALEVSNSQAKSWLNRLVAEGLIEKRNNPSSYVTKSKQLFE
ncbi:DNA-processing protein DprA [Novosphingobium sp. RD2P27]|uniref:DNA-processing protein DprA n=1 Tax=Novosphingobium kalidii TaxID=3230299 RepID=A0ABV2D1E3_9SPHN